MPDQKPVGFQFPKLFCQGGLRYPAKLAAQSAKPVNVMKRYVVEDLQLPFASQYLLER